MSKAHEKRAAAASGDQSAFLGTAPLGRTLWQFALPCIISLLISSLYNIVDQIFIGNSDLSYLGNASTSIVFPLTIISMAFAWCFGDGTAAYLSLSQGRGDTSRVHRAVGNSLLATLVVGVLFWLVGFTWMDPILGLFGASPTSLPLARDYFIIIWAAIPVYMLANTLSPIIRADGAPRFSMVATLVGAVTNLILDPIFIFPLGWGIKGAAWATIIGQIFSCLLSLFYLTRSQTFRLERSSWRPDWALFGETVKLGVSTFITQMSIVATSLVCNFMLARTGAVSKYGADIPIAVIGIVMKVFTIVISVAIGIMLGAQPIFGYNFGAGRYDRVRQLFRLVMTAVGIVGLVGTLIFELAPELIIALFGVESELYLEFAVKTFRIFLMLIAATCFIKAISIFFQAIGQPVKSAIVSLGRDIVCFIPLVIILPQWLGIEGILWASPIADIIGLSVTLALTIQFFRHLDSGTCAVQTPVRDC